jgi:hypothetical protein
MQEDNVLKKKNPMAKAHEALARKRAIKALEQYNLDVQKLTDRLAESAKVDEDFKKQSERITSIETPIEEEVKPPIINPKKNKKKTKKDKEEKEAIHVDKEKEKKKVKETEPPEKKTNSIAPTVKMSSSEDIEFIDVIPEKENKRKSKKKDKKSKKSKKRKRETFSSAEEDEPPMKKNKISNEAVEPLHERVLQLAKDKVAPIAVDYAQRACTNALWGVAIMGLVFCRSYMQNMVRTYNQPKIDGNAAYNPNIDGAHPRINDTPSNSGNNMKAIYINDLFR